MRLLSFTREPEQSLRDLEFGKFSNICMNEDPVNEYYELVDVTDDELEAWVKIADEIKKLGIWLQWNHSFPKIERVYDPLNPEVPKSEAHFKVSITIEYRPGFNIQDHFNKILRLA